MVYMYHGFLIHSSADGHLDCFYVLAIINRSTGLIGGDGKAEVTPASIISYLKITSFSWRIHPLTHLSFNCPKCL